jgi:hypothetical protein
LNVGSDGDAIPDSRIVGIAHVAVVDGAVSGVDESVFGEPDEDRGV